jgi:hypothetical protein
LRSLNTAPLHHPNHYYTPPTQGKISRDDVADLVVALLSLPAATDTTFEVKSTVPFSQPWGDADAAGQPARDWGATVAAAGLVPGVTGKTVGGVYSGRRPEAEVAAEAGKTAVNA